MNAFASPDSPDNPARDAWKPAEKADEAALDNPTEFRPPPVTTEDSLGPVPDGRPRTHGQAG